MESGTTVARTSAECVAEIPALIGEGPLWLETEQRLLWLDIAGRRLHVHDPAGGGDAVVELERRVGCIASRAVGGLVAATEDGFALLDPSTGALTLIAPVIAGDPALRMNDGRCDPRGRFWAGTMAYDTTAGAGCLFRLDADHTVQRILEGVTVSNGIDWTLDERTMYFIDSFAYGIDAFDYDANSGTVSNRRRFVDVANDTTVPTGFTVPDGLALDAADNLWVAIHGRGEVHCFDPRGRLQHVVQVGAESVTSVAFGGSDLGDLFITAAAGSLFRCRPGARGRQPRAYAG